LSFTLAGLGGREDERKNKQNLESVKMRNNLVDQNVCVSQCVQQRKYPPSAISMNCLEYDMKVDF